MVTAALHRRSPRGFQIAGDVAEVAGKVIRYIGKFSPTFVNLSGAAMASYGTALIYRPAGIILGAGFLLAMGRQLETRTPRAGNGRGG